MLASCTDWLRLTKAKHPLPCNRQHLSHGDRLEGTMGDYLTSSVLLCIIIVHPQLRELENSVGAVCYCLRNFLADSD